MCSTITKYGVEVPVQPVHIPIPRTKVLVAGFLATGAHPFSTIVGSSKTQAPITFGIIPVRVAGFIATTGRLFLIIVHFWVTVPYPRSITHTPPRLVMVQGAGAYLQSANATFNSCLFAHNTAEGANGFAMAYGVGLGLGGAIYSTGSTVAVKKCSFISDSANCDGGAIWNNLGTISVDSSVFDSCIALRNGIIYQGDSNLHLNHNVFQNGNAQSGGAVYASSYPNGYKVFANCNVFYRNKANQGGAIAYGSATTDANDTTINNVFVGNAAGLGGAIYLGDYYHFVCNNTFYADTALTTSGRGGALYLGGTNANDTVVNNIFFHNSSYNGDRDTSRPGSGIFYYAYNSGSLINPFFKDTTNLIGPDGIWGTQDDGLELNRCSWDIDAGASRFVYARDTTDIVGRPRIQSIAVNYGAYETIAPGYINGPGAVCVGAHITLTDTTALGWWTSSNATVASVNSSGVVTGVSLGIAIISYIFACGGTYRISNILVQRPASAITGASNLCIGATATLQDSTGGGAWSGSSTILTIGATTGIVTGLAAGTAIVAYTDSNICGMSTTTKTIHIQRRPSVITGIDSICVGSTTTLTDTVNGGVWTSNNVALAHIDSAGILTATAPGLDTFVYSVTNSCGTSTAKKKIKIERTASAITGPTVICAGSTANFADTIAGGVWVSSNPVVATIVTSGHLTALKQGSTIISYTVHNSCGTSVATDILTIERTASLITGTNTICLSSTTTLADSTLGGTWLCGDTTVAIVSNTGIVAGLAQGEAIVTYTVVNVCGTSTAIDTIKVQCRADLVSGPDAVCKGSKITLTNSANGGTWISNDPAIAIVNTGGDATGVATGEVIITYYLSNTCGHSFATKQLVVDGATSIIIGGDTLCQGKTLTLFDSTDGGIWQSTDTTIATINNGVVNGKQAGSTSISYSTNNACGAITRQKTIIVLAKETCDSLAGVDELNLGDGIAIFPNPTSGIIYIQSPSKLNFALNSIDGRKIIATNNVNSIDIGYLPDGIYMLMFYTETGELVKVEKIIKRD